MDDAFSAERELEEFDKIVQLGERPLYKHVYGFLDRGHVGELKDLIRQNPCIVRAIETRPVFARFAEFLPTE